MTMAGKGTACWDVTVCDVPSGHEQSLIWDSAWRVVMTNDDMLGALLAQDTSLPVNVPGSVLADWIQTIPSTDLYQQAHAALLARCSDHANAFREDEPPALETGGDSDGALAAWRVADFNPSVYSTDDETGERLRLSKAFVDAYGLTSNTPQKVYQMPEDCTTREKIWAWLMHEPPYEDREAYAVWMDWDWNEYDLIKGQFVRRTSP